MSSDLTSPPRMPEPGFYYHYKHDPEGPEENYAYEVLGTGHHTEQDQFLVVYRPLYETAFVYKLGKLFDVRPLAMFMESVEKEGKTFQRFTPITDPALIERLHARRDRMYPKGQ